MTKHIPVLLPEVMRYLDVKSGDIVLDATVGSGGYAQAIATSLGSEGKLVGIDADKEAIFTTKRALADYDGDSCLIQDNFRNIPRVLEKCGVDSLDKAVFDLGFRSEQLEMNRGFSFQEESPLLMTFKDPDSLTEGDITAFDVVNKWSQESLINIFTGYSNERYAEQIAQAITESRQQKSIDTTADLVRIIKKSVPRAYRNRRRHPATLVFQAIRIAVNDEVNALREGLQTAFDSLKDTGRLAVVSFHSLEDRTVKEFFSDWEAENKAESITDSPVTAGSEEVSFNPRSRSAKLRVIQKCSAD